MNIILRLCNLWRRTFYAMKVEVIDISYPFIQISGRSSKFPHIPCLVNFNALTFMNPEDFTFLNM